MSGTPVAAYLCMTRSPIVVEVHSPAKLERIQLLLRVLLVIMLGWLGFTAGWLVWALYLFLPVIAALAVSLDRFRSTVAPREVTALSWLLQLSAYMMLLTDRFPAGDDTVRIEMPVRAYPTVKSSLWRLVSSLPSGALLIVMWFVSAVLWLAAAVAVLVGASIPASINGFQRGVLRWQARLVAYHASLVDDYPPVELATGEIEEAAAPLAAGAR